MALSLDEVRSRLAHVHQARYRICLTTIYACGLRLQEGFHLQVADIADQRMLSSYTGEKAAKIAMSR